MSDNLQPDDEIVRLYNAADRYWSVENIAKELRVPVRTVKQRMGTLIKKGVLGRRQTADGKYHKPLGLALREQRLAAEAKRARGEKADCGEDYFGA